MAKNGNIKKIKEKIIPILKNYEVNRAGLFGSCVRGKMRKNSDVDLLVEIKKDISLLEFVGLKIKIEKALGRKVDLVEYDTLKPILRERILREEVVIL